MSLLDVQAAELDFTDHPDDAANWPLNRQYMVCRGSRSGGDPRRCTHIVARAVDYLPAAYQTVCYGIKRGTLTTGPTAALPLCRACADRGAGIYHSGAHKRRQP